MYKRFQYKAKISRATAGRAERQLALCAELYNAALQERRDAWQRSRITLRYPQQNRQLPEIKRLRPEYKEIGSQVLQDVLRRLDKAFVRFFDGLATGGKHGYPRFKSASRYRSLTFYQTGWKLDGRILRLQGIGTMKLFLSRPIEGTIKNVTLQRDQCGDWFVTFCCADAPARRLPSTGKEVGIDVGLESFLVTSEGAAVENPRHFRRAEAAIKRAQRRVSKRARGGARRKKMVRALARRHRKVARARRDFHSKTALALVRQYDTIAVEDLAIRRLARGRLAKSVNDASWGQFFVLLSFKAAEAGKRVVAVNARGTTQICSACGHNPTQRKTLSDRVHACEQCGVRLHRDVNAALNVLQRARAEPSASSPACKAAA